jgi:hypothetical protein
VRVETAVVGAHSAEAAGALGTGDISTVAAATKGAASGHPPEARSYARDLHKPFAAGVLRRYLDLHRFRSGRVLMLGGLLFEGHG